MAEGAPWCGCSAEFRHGEKKESPPAWKSKKERSGRSWRRARRTVLERETLPSQEPEKEELPSPAPEREELPSPTPRMGEPERPAPRMGEVKHPQPKKGKPACPELKKESH
ncbi:UNVERIFIED_CONTAM: hypothetical protein FKN15_045281 [Acipenser sinensis]